MALPTDLRLLLVPLLLGLAAGLCRAEPRDDAYRLRLPDPDSFRLRPTAGYQANLPTIGEAPALPYDEQIRRAARQQGIDPNLLHAVVKVESAYNSKAVSPKGAVGLMQLMPDTAGRYGVREIRDTEQNLAGGAAYLRDLLHRFDNDLPLALAAYNAGEGAVEHHGRRIPPYAETRRYVPAVMDRYHELSVRRQSPYQLNPNFR